MVNAEEAKDAVENALTSTIESTGNIVGIVTHALADVIRELSDLLSNVMDGGRK